MRLRLCQLCAATLLSGLASGCAGGKVLPGYSVVSGGNAHTGEQVIEQRRCGSCHMIPGVPHANGVFGPPLELLAERTIIAGNFPNQPDNLVRWIMSPTSMKPKTAMPDLGLSEQQSRDAAAYLYTLR